MNTLRSRCLIAVGALLLGPGAAVADMPDPASLQHHADNPSDASAGEEAANGVPWVVAIVVAPVEVSPATLLGLRPDEVLSVDGADPARGDVLAQALRHWQTPVILVVADAAEAGRAEQKTLLELCPPLREAVAGGDAALELLTTSGSAAPFVLRGPHPDAARLLQPVPVAEVSSDSSPHASALPAALLELAEKASAQAATPPTSARPSGAPIAPPAVPVDAVAAAGEEANGNTAFAFLGLLTAVSLIVWVNRERLLPGGVPGLARFARPAMAPAAPGTASAQFQSPNLRLAAAVNQLREKLRLSASQPETGR